MPDETFVLKKTLSASWSVYVCLLFAHSEGSSVGKSLSWSECVSVRACTCERVVCVRAHVCALFDIKATVVFFLHFISHIPNDAASPRINSEVRRNRFLCILCPKFHALKTSKPIKLKTEMDMLPEGGRCHQLFENKCNCKQTRFHLSRIT